jgi:hypothetical protein
MGHDALFCRQTGSFPGILAGVRGGDDLLGLCTVACS